MLYVINNSLLLVIVLITSVVAGGLIIMRVKKNYLILGLFLLLNISVGFFIGIRCININNACYNYFIHLCTLLFFLPLFINKTIKSYKNIKYKYPEDFIYKDGDLINKNICKMSPYIININIKLPDSKLIINARALCDIAFSKWIQIVLQDYYLKFPTYPILHKLKNGDKISFYNYRYGFKKRIEINKTLEENRILTNIKIYGKQIN